MSLKASSSHLYHHCRSAAATLVPSPLVIAPQAHLQVDDGVRAVALHGVELQVSLEVLGVEPRDWQTVAESGLERKAEMGSWIYGRLVFGRTASSGSTVKQTSCCQVSSLIDLTTAVTFWKKEHSQDLFL